MEFDYSKLIGKIAEVYGTKDKLAAELKTMSATTLNYKLNNKVSWKQQEIIEVATLLGIINEIQVYFFTLKVEKTQQKEK